MANRLSFTDAEQANLSELAELDMSLARHAHAQALASDDPATIAELGRTYQRAARSARQSIALAAKLRRDAAQDAAAAERLAERAAMLNSFTRFAEPEGGDTGWFGHDDDEDYEEEEDEDEDEREDTATRRPPIDPAILEREAELRAAVRRVIWDERERLEIDETPDELFGFLEERLESRRQRPAPAERSLDDEVLDICAALGLPTDCAKDWRNLPDPEVDHEGPTVTARADSS